MKKSLGIFLICIAFMLLAMHLFGHALFYFKWAFMNLMHHVVLIALGFFGLYLLFKRKK